MNDSARHPLLADLSLAHPTGAGGVHGGPLLEALQAGKVAMVLVDCRLPARPVLLSNDAYARLSGYDATEIAGRPWQFMRGPLTDEQAAARLDDAVAQGAHACVDLLNYRKDGSLFWNRIVVAPIRGEDGAACFLSLQSDVTLAHQGELGRDAADDRVAEEIPAGSQVIGEWNWDITRDLIYADARYASYFSVPAGRAAVGARPEEFAQGIHADDRARVLQEAMLARDTGAFYSEFRTQKDGELRWVASRGACPRDSDGVARKFTGVSWDITEQKRAEEMLRESAVELRLITDSLPVLIGYVDAEQRFRFNNQAYLDWLGMSPQELYGKTVREVVGERAYEIRRPYIEAALAGTPARFEGYAPHRDGTPHHALMQILPRRLPDGTVSGCYVMVFDITDRKRAEETMREHGERMDALINQAAVGILQVDLVGRITMANHRYADIVGRSQESLIGHQVVDFFHEDDAPRGRALLARLIATGEPAFIESRYVRPDGGQVWVSSHLSVLRDETGRPRHASVIVTDISSRKQSEQRQAALLELGDRLRELSDTGDITGVAARIICAGGGIIRAGFGLVDDSGLYVEVERDWMAGPSTTSVAGRHSFADYGHFFADLNRGDTVNVPDILLDPRTEPGAGRLLGIGIRALLNVPLMEQGKLVAVLFLHHDAPRSWDSDEVNFVRNVADRTWAAVKRATADAAIKRLNETLEQRVAERTADVDRMWRLSTDIMLVTGFDMRVAALNPAWKVALGWDADQLVGSFFPDLVHEDDQEATMNAIGRLSKGLATLQFESRLRHRDGGYRWFSWRAAADDVGIHAVGRDVTAEREAAQALRHAEDQLRQAQKMEAVGQLTGGIAHDFNNLLQGVIGPLDLIRRSIQLGRLDNLGRFIDAATNSAKRAAALTHRLLAFSRRQALDLRPVDLNVLVGSLEDLLRRTIGEGIALETELARDLWPAFTDANQLENALLNLVINARDAMPGGGAVVVSTSNIEVGQAQARLQNGLRTGHYVMLSVVDTGVGMTPEVIAKAFDPFFTTKPIGQGTGLGLSMIYGFAKQSNGHAYIKSEPGLGTRVDLYLPRCASPVLKPEAEAGEHDGLQGDGETVLVVEDDPAVRMVVVEVLLGLGYQALEARDGREGLAVVESPQRIDLMITDVGMPNLNGRELAALARRERPGLKVLFMTGYAGNAVIRSGFLDAGMDMIAKPFALDALAAKIRDMIAQQPAG